MIQTKKNLVEVCPQCCKSVDSSACRLVYDTCGHSKCRICLIQEVTGCLLCNSVIEKSFDDSQFTCKEPSKRLDNIDCHKRKSVITSLALQQAEEEQQNVKTSSLSVDKDTCNLIKQSFEKNILFPTDIVKRSTGNFYHLKRIFSQRFFNENNNKKHKPIEVKDKLHLIQDEAKKEQKIECESLSKKNWKVPSHIQVQYYCTVHNLSLEEKTLLKQHMSCVCSSEKSDNPTYSCKICSKSYKVIGKLNRHMKSHTKNSRFKCQKCGKLCIDNYALKTHERTHTKSKPYSCSTCQKKFSGFQNLKRHEKSHKNEKQFVCNECGFKFITKTELKRHAVTHTNLKLFKCQICLTKFAFKRTLTRHAKTHDANLSKVKCPHCDSTFNRKDNLERHIKTAHCELKTDISNQ